MRKPITPLAYCSRRTLGHRGLPQRISSAWYEKMSRLRYILLLACCILAASLLLLLLWRFVGNYWAAAGGVLIIWLASLLCFVLHVFAVLKPPHEPEEFLASINAGLHNSFWLMQIAFVIAPGVWIGLVAPNPLALSAISIIFLETIIWLNHALPSRLPLPRPELRRLKGSLATAVTFLAATVVGMEIRAWLRW